ncbi:MAG: hypothetical protein JJ850_04345 [Kordiimonadaceae bacterium]|nr:hypothetical protein [Kordiimonadaceae bacterium]MBO6568452.1 hypothetical protein [Kordiimonadaceae bacterium]MBO6963819.1 hypothetical protein [Kordiimonadaceae bacterium]
MTYKANTTDRYESLPACIPHTYDLNGNLTDDGTYTYTPYGENRLTEARLKTGNIQVGGYKYDALGRRSKKTNYVQGTVTTRYLYAGDQVLAEYNGSN